VRNDLVHRLGLRPLEDGAKGLEQLPHRHLQPRRLARTPGAFHVHQRLAGEHVAVQQRPLRQRQRGLAVALVIQQLAHQIGARVCLLLFFAPFRRRQQHARLDQRESRGHDEELAGDVEIQPAHHFQIRQVLLGDRGDGDVNDLHLVLLDEVQQQIEGTFEDGELDAVQPRGANSQLQRVRLALLTVPLGFLSHHSPPTPQQLSH
jgi:hypothetical protein